MCTTRFSCRLGGGSAQELSAWGVSASVHPPAHCMLGYTPSVNRITDRWKNITFLQLRLRTVKSQIIRVNSRFLIVTLLSITETSVARICVHRLNSCTCVCLTHLLQYRNNYSVSKPCSISSRRRCVINWFLSTSVFFFFFQFWEIVGINSTDYYNLTWTSQKKCFHWNSFVLVITIYV